MIRDAIGREIQPGRALNGDFIADARTRAWANYLFLIQARDALITGRALAAERFAIAVGDADLEQVDRAVVDALRALSGAFEEPTIPATSTPKTTMRPTTESRGAWGWGV